MLSAVFDLFTQGNRSLDRSQGGLGVGLTLVRRLVEMHGGKVSAHSAGPGRGSEFVVRLPVQADARPPENAPSGPRQPEERQPCRILIVEDNVDSAESLAKLLRLMGHEVEAVHDGPAALEVAPHFRPEVVLLDIGLPLMDGYQTAQKLRELPGLEKTLLVAVTGYGRPEDRRCSREAGFDYHLVKPIDPLTLGQVLAARESRTAAPTLA
jgi:two-component system CheB/CheR fusion protein